MVTSLNTQFNQFLIKLSLNLQMQRLVKKYSVVLEKRVSALNRYINFKYVCIVYILIQSRNSFDDVYCI